MTIAANPLRPAAGAPRPYRFPSFTRHQLPNGLTLWLVPVSGSSLVNVHLLLDAGAAAEDEPHGGIAALTARMLVTGTQRLDASAFAEATERLGIEVSSESSWDSARAAFQALPEHFDAGLALLAEMIREPRFDAGEFERLKAERLASILQSRADPGRLAAERLLSEAYAEDTPYRRLAAGTPETVGTLTRDDVVGHHETHVRPGLSHLVIGGAFEPDAVVASVERHLGTWAGAGPGHRTFTPRAAGARRIVIVDRPGSVQTELRVGHLGIDRYDARYFPAIVMGTALGGSFWSRLNRRLREELGYTYGAHCGFDPRRAPGPFVAAAAVQTEVTAPAIGELVGVLEGATRAPFEEAELREARDYQVGVFPLRFETTGGIAAAIEPIAVYGLADDFWQTYRTRLEAVGPAEAHAAAVELIRPDELVILAVGDAALIRDEVTALGVAPVEVIEAP
ncbi:MAG: insulinase family protein [Chloroflexota bacterium]|nr:insulinase family protein [Chloroflexota bacterium]